MSNRNGRSQRSVPTGGRWSWRLAGVMLGVVAMTVLAIGMCVVAQSEGGERLLVPPHGPPPRPLDEDPRCLLYVTADTGGTATGSGSVDLEHCGSTFTARAMADWGYAFSHWIGGDCGAHNPCSIAVGYLGGPATAVELRAIFEPRPRYELTIFVPGNRGWVDPTNGPYFEGDVVELDARPYGPFIFHGWGGACAGQESSACEITMNSDKDVVAYFCHSETDPSACHLWAEMLRSLSI